MPEDIPIQRLRTMRFSSKGPIDYIIEQGDGEVITVVEKNPQQTHRRFYPKSGPVSQGVEQACKLICEFTWVCNPEEEIVTGIKAWKFFIDDHLKHNKGA
jgi:hypothetical protein